MKKAVAIILMLVMVLAATALAADKAKVSKKITSASQIKDDKLYYNGMTEAEMRAVLDDISLCKKLTKQLPKIGGRFYVVSAVEYPDALRYLCFFYDGSTWGASYGASVDVDSEILRGTPIYPVYKNTGKSVDTGDSTPVMLLGGLMLLGAFGMVALKRKKA